MPNYEYVGTLKNGRHTVVTLGRTFEAGEEVPLTEKETVLFAAKFDNVRKAKAVLLDSAAEKAAADAAEKAAADAEKESAKGKK